jgi:hypothetical protein
LFTTCHPSKSQIGIIKNKQGYQGVWAHLVESQMQHFKDNHLLETHHPSNLKIGIFEIYTRISTAQ